MRPPLVVVEGGEEGDRDPRPLAMLVAGGDVDAVALASVHAALVRTGVFRVALTFTGEDDAELRAELDLPVPDHVLRLQPASHGMQIASALSAAERVFQATLPAVVIVTGCTDSVLGAALAAAKLGVGVARVDAGRRVRDWGEPAEVNCVLLDAMADSLFASSEYEVAALEREGVGAGRLQLVGSTVADEMRRAERRVRSLDAWRPYGLDRGGYVLAVLRSAARCTDDERLARTVEALAKLAQRVRVAMPTSVRLRERLEAMGDIHRLEAAGVLCLPPQGHLDHVSLQLGAAAILTDSGTVQESTSALGVQCFTIGSTTNRPITVSHGTNSLLGDDVTEISAVSPVAALPVRCAIPLWEGRAGDRIAAGIVANYALVRAC